MTAPCEAEADDYSQALRSQKENSETLRGYLQHIETFRSDLEVRLQDLASVCASMWDGKAKLLIPSSLLQESSGNVGIPSPILEYKLRAIPDMGYKTSGEVPAGEILVRGPILFTGYFSRTSSILCLMLAGSFLCASNSICCTTDTVACTYRDFLNNSPPKASNLSCLMKAAIATRHAWSLAEAIAPYLPRYYT